MLRFGCCRCRSSGKRRAVAGEGVRFVPSRSQESRRALEGFSLLLKGQRVRRRGRRRRRRRRRRGGRGGSAARSEG